MEIRKGNLYIDRESSFNKHIVVQLINTPNHNESLKVQVVKNPTVKNPEYTKGDTFYISIENFKSYFYSYNRIKKL